MESKSLKVVVHLRNGDLLKGYTDALPGTDLGTLLDHEPVSIALEVPVRLSDTGELTVVPLNAVKALYFVRTFEGSKEYKEIKFFEGHPTIAGLWVRMKFQDNELTEGVVRNSLHYVMNPGFLLKPPDPISNNELVYVVKSSLRAFEVLGVRHTY